MNSQFPKVFANPRLFALCFPLPLPPSNPGHRHRSTFKDSDWAVDSIAEEGPASTNERQFRNPTVDRPNQVRRQVERLRICGVCYATTRLRRRTAGQPVIGEPRRMQTRGLRYVCLIKSRLGSDSVISDYPILLAQSLPGSSMPSRRLFVLISLYMQHMSMWDRVSWSKTTAACR